MIERRQLITGLISFVAAPAIVRAASLMPVKYDRFRFVTTGPYGIIERIQIDSNYNIWMRINGKMVPLNLPPREQKVTHQLRREVLKLIQDLPVFHPVLE